MTGNTQEDLPEREPTTDNTGYESLIWIEAESFYLIIEDALRIVEDNVSERVSIVSDNTPREGELSFVVQLEDES